MCGKYRLLTKNREKPTKTHSSTKRENKKKKKKQKIITKIRVKAASVLDASKTRSNAAIEK